MLVTPDKYNQRFNVQHPVDDVKLAWYNISTSWQWYNI